MDTLKEYIIHYPHIKITMPTSTLAKKVLHKMCTAAAEVLDRQAGREYGFGEAHNITNQPRATQLNLLTEEELAGLPTNNLDAERHSAVFFSYYLICIYSTIFN